MSVAYAVMTAQQQLVALAGAQPYQPHQRLAARVKRRHPLATDLGLPMVLAAALDNTQRDGRGPVLQHEARTTDGVLDHAAQQRMLGLYASQRLLQSRCFETTDQLEGE